MIVRKPYAFLIKYFKIIHIMLFVFMTYMVFKIRNIYMLFKNLVINNLAIYSSEAISSYINITMILSSIILIIALLAIFFLMRQKKKPIVYYLLAVIFYTITFISLIFFLTVFNNLEYQTYSNQSIVLFRDLSMTLYYLNYYFLIIAFIRGFGFNIKKFNFEKDIKELDITEEDREEIEVGVSIEYDDVSNFFRKRKRLFKYYLKENSFILIIFLVIMLLSLTAYFSIDKFIVNKIYNEDDIITLNNVSYVVNSSYITNKDKNGNYIKNKDTYYLIIDFDVLNKNEGYVTLEIQNYRVKIEDKYYYPINNISSKISDLGIIYKNQKIFKDSKSNYILAFEIGNKIEKKVVFELYNYTKKVEEDAVLDYKKINLDPNLFSSYDLGTYKLLEEVNLEKTYFNFGVFNLNSYELLDIVNYTYTKCDNDILDGKCIDYDASVVANAGKKILKLKYALSIDQNIFDYLIIKYTKNNKEYKITSDKIKNVTPDNYEENIILLEIPNDIFDSSKVSFLFNIREVNFEYLTEK